MTNPKQKLLALYPLMIPFGNITFSQFTTACQEAYKTDENSQHLSYFQYLDEMLKRALEREAKNNKERSSS